MQTSSAPRCVQIAAALAITSGVGSVVSMTYALVCGRISIDMGFIGIPIGFGLLTGKSSSRFWAQLGSLLGLLAYGILFFVSLWRNTRSPTGFGAVEQVVLNLHLLLSAFACAFVFIALGWERSKVWFNQPQIDQRNPRTLGLIVVVVAGYLLISQAATDYLTIKTLQKLFYFETKVTPVDDQSGQPLSTISNESATSSKYDVLPKIMVSYGFGAPNQCYLEAKGIAAHPYVMKLSSPGYESATVAISNDSPREMSLRLKKLPAPLDLGK